MPEGHTALAAGTPITCRRCHNKLGEWVEEGLVRQQHRGRHSLGLPILIRCEGCGQNWTPPASLIERLLDLLGGPEVPEPVIAGTTAPPQARRLAVAAA